MSCASALSTRTPGALTPSFVCSWREGGSLSLAPRICSCLAVASRTGFRIFNTQARCVALTHLCVLVVTFAQVVISLTR